MSEEFEIGDCSLHRRTFEVFCTNCNTLICPSCLMFEPHKGHNVCKIEDATKFIRNEIDLAVENTENILLDIRHTKLTSDETKQKIIKEVDNTFTTLVKALKQRKQEVFKEIEDHYAQEIEKLQLQEEKWSEKQDIGNELLNFARNPDDVIIVSNANKIIESIQNLREIKNYQTISLLNTVDTNFYINVPGRDKTSNYLTLKEVLKASETFVKKGEIINLQFRS